MKPCPRKVSSRYVEAVRKLWWHGTSIKNLRRILKEGLLPRGTKKVFTDEMGQAGMRSIKTFGGVYLTDNWMTAYSAAGTAGGRDVPRLIVGVTYETRSPEVLADEDDVLPLADWSVGSNYDDLRTHKSPWANQWKREHLSYYEGAFNPEYLNEVGDIIDTGDISSAVQTFLGFVFQKWPGAERGYRVRKGEVDQAVDSLLRAHAAHLVEQEILKNRERRIRRLTENLENLVDGDGVPIYDDPEEAKYWADKYRRSLHMVQNPPERFKNTWAKLKDATEEVSRLIPEMSGPEDRWVLRHNIRTMEPITYRGKNRILMVVEVKDGTGDDWRYSDLIFHYGAQHWREFVAPYRERVGDTYRVLDRSGKVLGWSLSSGQEWPTHLWGPSPRAVAASWVGERWGHQGSGFLFSTEEGKVLLVKRSSWVTEPGTWGIPGGAVEGSDIKSSALREVAEEIGSVPQHRLNGRHVFRDGEFVYTTFLATVPAEFRPTLNHESTDWAWVTRDEALSLNLHTGVRILLQKDLG